MVKVRALRNFETENGLIEKGTEGKVALELINTKTYEDIFLLEFNHAIVIADILEFEII